MRALEPEGRRASEIARACIAVDRIQNHIDSCGDEIGVVSDRIEEKESAMVSRARRKTQRNGIDSFVSLYTYLCTRRTHIPRRES